MGIGWSAGVYGIIQDGKCNIANGRVSLGVERIVSILILTFRILQHFEEPFLLDIPHKCRDVQRPRRYETAPTGSTG